MSNVITTRMLEAAVNRLNTMTGNPVLSYDTPKTPEEAKQYSRGHVPQKGNYHIDGAYGGVKLIQFTNGSGCRDISNNGYGTKRELYNFIHAMLEGVEVGKVKGAEDYKTAYSKVFQETEQQKREARLINRAIDGVSELQQAASLYPREDWLHEVNNGDTALGYVEWLSHKVESES